ncbi:Serine/threonine-protein kinase haspin [Blomia tropicalis]|nr:Serine/threonine-protein kinase haspin [Blomia tropicalis]
MNCDQASLSSIRSEVDDYWHRVLSLCHQRNPFHFGMEFPSKAFNEFEYLDSGTYSHVIKAIEHQGGTPVIIKVVQRTTLSRMSDIPISGFELYLDVYQEIVIMKMLSNLHDNVSDIAGYEYQTHSFPRIFRSRVVHGEIPNYFLIRKYDETIPKIKKVDRFDDTFGVPREYLVVVMKFGGDSLWDRIQSFSKDKLLPDQIISLCYQTILALAVSEQVLQFEHRDLHICNMLVKETKKKEVHFKIRSVDYYVKSFSIKACIIDTTFSRMAVAGVIHYTDLSSRLKSSTENPKPEEHEIVYADMYRLVADRWTEWFPQTNVQWLRYCFKELSTCSVFEEFAEEHHKNIMKNLIDLIENQKTVFDFVKTLFKSGDNPSERLYRETPNNMQNEF